MSNLHTLYLFGIEDTYAESGDPQDLLVKYGLMPIDIVSAVQHHI